MWCPEPTRSFASIPPRTTSSRPSASGRTRVRWRPEVTGASGWRVATTLARLEGRSRPKPSRAQRVRTWQAHRSRGRRWARHRLQRPARCKRRRHRRLDGSGGERHPAGRSAASVRPRRGRQGRALGGGRRPPHRTPRLDAGEMTDPTSLAAPRDERADAFFSSVAVSGDAIWILETPTTEPCGESTCERRRRRENRT